MSTAKPCPYNHDCFHCPEPDCICCDKMTKKESDIIKGAHGGWDMEIRTKRIAYMLKHGIPTNVMFELIGVTPSQYSHARKKAALLLEQEKRREKK